MNEEGEQEGSPEEMIPLSKAEKRLSMSWKRAWRALLAGRLQGERRDGRRYVTVASVRQYERGCEPASMVGSAATSRTEVK